MFSGLESLPLLLSSVLGFFWPQSLSLYVISCCGSL